MENGKNIEFSKKQKKMKYRLLQETCFAQPDFATESLRTDSAGSFIEKKIQAVTKRTNSDFSENNNF